MKNKKDKDLGMSEYEDSFDSHMEHVNHDLEQIKSLYSKQVDNTIVFFGSAVISPEVDETSRNPGGLCMADYYHAADELAYRFAQWSSGFKDPKQQYTLCSGGGPGIMEATNKGAHRAGEKSMGLRIIIPLEQETNVYVSPELTFDFHYFYFRKLAFLHAARVIVIFPGGMGTLDEVFEILNLIRARKVTDPIPIVFFGSEYWKEIINFEPMLKYGTVQQEDLSMIHYSDDVEDAFRYVTKFLEEQKKNK